MLKQLDTSRWSRSDIIKEAKLQTDAIQRLNVWLRLGYSLIAVGFILGLWASQAGSTPGIIAAVIFIVVGAPVALILKVGTTRARKNVEALLTAAGVDVEELRRHPITHDDEEQSGKTVTTAK